MGTKKTSNQKETVKISETHNEKSELGEYDTHRHMKVKEAEGNLRGTCVTNLL